MTLGTTGLNWLSYNPANISISGTAPGGQATTALPLGITDKYGDTVNTTLSLAFFPSHFASDKLSSALASPGQPFDVSLAEYFTNGTSDGASLTITFHPQKASSWLSFSSSNDSLQASVPGDIDYDSVTVLLRAQDLVTHAWSHAEMMTLPCAERDLQRGSLSSSELHNRHEDRARLPRLDRRRSRPPRSHSHGMSPVRQESHERGLGPEQ